jgi:hypothetical protein
MPDLITHIRDVIDHHAKRDCHDDGDSVVDEERRS